MVVDTPLLEKAIQPRVVKDAVTLPEASIIRHKYGLITIPFNFRT